MILMELGGKNAENGGIGGFFVESGYFTFPFPFPEVKYWVEGVWLVYISGGSGGDFFPKKMAPVLPYILRKAEEAPLVCAADGHFSFYFFGYYMVFQSPMRGDEQVGRRLGDESFDGYCGVKAFEEVDNEVDIFIY
jgi:hypothetical protein